MKRIGIIGGMAPESTLLYYKYIIDEYRKHFEDHRYPEIIIYSVNFQEFIDLMNEDKWSEIAKKLIEITYSLQNAGADFALIATNTMHVIFQDVANSSPIPLLSIIDSVADEIKRFNIHTVGLLGTKVTMENGFYQKGLSTYGINVVIPDQDDRYEINKVIFKELVNGKILKKSKTLFLTIVHKLIERGVEGIVLGCTEIPLLINQKDVNTKIFDSTYIHAQKALQYAQHL